MMSGRNFGGLERGAPMVMAKKPMMQSAPAKKTKMAKGKKKMAPPMMKGPM